MQRSDTEFIRTIERFIREHHLLKQGDTIVAAVSGGPDSTALLHILHRLSEEWGWTVAAAHLNHQFRGAESEREADMVQAFAASLGLACVIGSVDVPDIIRTTGMNAQTAAREQRYAFLTSAAAQMNANRLAMAHHADDQSETMLMRILRGTGPSGLTGIPMRRQLEHLELVRPLLRIYKTELIRYCQDGKLPYAEDSSNRSRKYTRNRLRLDVLPALLPYNPQLPESLNRLAEMMQEEDDYIEKEARQAWRSLVTEQANGYTFSRTAFLALHIALQRRLIQLILSYVCAGADASDYNRIERIRETLGHDRSPSLMIHLQGEAVLLREYDVITVVRDAQPDRLLQTDTDLTGTIERSDPWSGAVMWGGALYSSLQSVERVVPSRPTATPDQCADNSEPRKCPSHQEAFFDFDQVIFPLTVRCRRDGDRMEPLGLNGTKKVKDMFIDRKVPLRMRDKIPVVEDAAGHILWIPGVGRSRYALQGPNTKQVLILRFNPLDEME